MDWIRSTTLEFVLASQVYVGLYGMLEMVLSLTTKRTQILCRLFAWRISGSPWILDATVQDMAGSILVDFMDSYFMHLFSRWLIVHVSTLSDP
jgi:aminopeptidase-like protein